VAERFTKSVSFLVFAGILTIVKEAIVGLIHERAFGRWHHDE